MKTILITGLMVLQIALAQSDSRSEFDRADLQAALNQSKEFVKQITELRDFKGSYEEKLTKGVTVFSDYFAVASIGATVLGPSDWEDLRNGKDSDVQRKAYINSYINSYKKFVAAYFMDSLGKAEGCVVNENPTTVTIDGKKRFIVNGNLKAAGQNYNVDLHFIKTKRNNSDFLGIIDVKVDNPTPGTDGGISQIIDNHHRNFNTVIQMAKEKKTSQDLTALEKTKILIDYMNCMVNDSYGKLYKNESGASSATECAQRAIESVK